MIEVELPDGTIAEFPDGTPEGVMRTALLKQSAGQPSVAEDVVKSGAAGLPRGAADLIGLPGTIGDAARGGMQWLMRKGYEGATGAEPSSEGGMVERFFAGNPEMEAKMIGGGSNPLSGQNIRGALSAATGGATDYQPQTTAGEYARTGAEFLPGALAFGGGSIGNAIRYGAVPAVASETAGQLTKGTPFEPYARTGGALVGGIAGARIAQPKASKMPTATDIKKSAGYADLKAPMKAAQITKETYGGIVNNLRAVADDFGVVPELHGPIETILLRHGQKAAQGGASMHDLEIMRRSLLNAAKNPMNPSAGELSRQLIDKLDESVGAISSRNLVAAEGEAADKTLGALKEARSTWQIGKKAEVVESAMERAKNAASGFENGLRVEFRKLLNNEKLARQFTPTEKLAIQQVVRGTFKGNMLRLLGGFGIPLDNARNFLGSVIGGGVGGSLGAAVAGPAGAAIGGPLLMGIGTASKAASNALTRNQATVVEALVKAGPKASEIFGEALAAMSVADREAILRAVLQGQSAARVPAERARAR